MSPALAFHPESSQTALIFSLSFYALLILNPNVQVSDTT